MPELHVNIDHIATLRQARRTYEPSPLAALKLLEKTQTSGVTVHLREDRRHIQDSDIFEIDNYLRESFKLGLTFEMGATEEIRAIALQTKANLVTLVPEKRQEITTEGGLDILAQKKYLSEFIKPIHDTGIKVSMFIDPVEEQVRAAKEIGADFIELHTGNYANSFMIDFDEELKYNIDKVFTDDSRDIKYFEKNSISENTKSEIKKLQKAAKYAAELGLNVNLGHGLTVENLPLLLHGHSNSFEGGIPQARELHIGHSIIANSIYIGIDKVVNNFLEILLVK